MTNTKHTPTPLDINKISRLATMAENYEPDHFGSYHDSNDAMVILGDLRELQRHLPHIVKCVNMHEELVEALKEAQDCIRFGDRVSEADRIISETLKKAGAL